MRVIETSLGDVLRERASVQPDDTAFTFIDSNGIGTALPKAWRGHIFIGEQTNLARELEQHGMTNTSGRHVSNSTGTADSPASTPRRG